MRGHGGRPSSMQPPLHAHLLPSRATGSFLRARMPNSARSTRKQKPCSAAPRVRLATWRLPLVGACDTHPPVSSASPLCPPCTDARGCSAAPLQRCDAAAPMHRCSWCNTLALRHLRRAHAHARAQRLPVLHDRSPFAESVADLLVELIVNEKTTSTNIADLVKESAEVGLLDHPLACWCWPGP